MPVDKSKGESFTQAQGSLFLKVKRDGQQEPSSYQDTFSFTLAGGSKTFSDISTYACLRL